MALLAPPESSPKGRTLNTLTQRVGVCFSEVNPPTRFLSLPLRRRRRGLLFAKLKATTLVEVIVAMMIIMFSFGLAMVIYNQVLGSENGVHRLRAHLLLNKIADEAKMKRYFLDEVIESESLTVRKTVTKYKGNGHLLLLHLEAMDKNRKVISERRELVYQR